MHRYRIAGFLLISFLFSAVVNADAPVVNQSPDFSEQLTKIEKIAIVPIDPCPAALDCAEVERQLFLEFRAAWRPSVVQASQTRQKMFELGISSLDSATRSRLAEALAVTAFLIPSVPYTGSKSQPAALVLPAGQAPEARVELSLIVVDSDLPLFRGTNQGQGTTMHRPEGLINRLFKGILGKAFPKRKR